MLIKKNSEDYKTNKTQKEMQLDELYVAVDPIDVYDKVTIDIKEVVDYSFCPKYYHIKYNNDNINIRSLYDKCIRNVFKSYLLALQGDKLNNTLEFLKYRWGKEWIEHKYQSTKQLLVTPSASRNDNYENLRKAGIDTIFNFDELMAKDKQYPIIIDHKYQIEILPNIILTGTYEYVRELTIDDQKVIEIVGFIVNSNRFETSISRKFNLELIAASYAFKETFEVDYFRVVSIDIYTKSININTYTKQDYDLLKESVRGTVISLQNNIQCVSPNKVCYHCEYRNVCINML